MNFIELPERIFLTGVPGSKWSGLAQTLETNNSFNTSDRMSWRSYEHHQFSGHQGSYFGTEMELLPTLDPAYIDNAWKTPNKCKIVKSHEWAYCLEDIRTQFPNDWIMLVYRPDLASYAWWHEAGGFNIKYPSYSWYKDSPTMLGKIAEQNKCILSFAHLHNLSWSYFTTEWIENTFGIFIDIPASPSDVLVTILK